MDGAAGDSVRLVFFFAIALARRSCSRSLEVEALLLDLERSEEATTGQSCEASKVILHLLRLGGAKSRPACAGVTLRFGGSPPSARISSSRDSTDATACCKKFHLEVDVGFDAILMRQTIATSAVSKAAI